MFLIIEIIIPHFNLKLSIQDDVPMYEEIKVQEVNLSVPVLKAGAFHLGKACELENNKFILCHTELNDPQKCLDEAKALVSCGLKCFQSVKESCGGEFSQYVNCLDKSSSNEGFTRCCKNQVVFDKCMLDNFGLERPYYGYFTRLKVHNTLRSKPPVEDPAIDPDANPNPPKDTEKTCKIWNALL